MLAFSRNQQAIRQHNLPATPSLTVWGTQLTAHATPHSKGAWATLMTTTYAVHGFWIGLAGSAVSATQTDMMLDIAIGAAQENVIVPEFLCGWIGSIAGGSARWVYFPIYIPRGTLVSGRIQALITVDTLQVTMHANGGTSTLPGPLFIGCDAYGTNIAASQGTSHTPGDSGAESTDANIGTTASKHYGAVMIGMNGTLANTTMSGLAYHWECTLGGVTLAEWYVFLGTGENVIGPYPPAPVSTSIPAGSQLQVQAEASGASAQAQDVALYCFY